MIDERPFSLEGRRAVVTGGARGLGLGMAKALAAAGAAVAVVARTATTVEQAIAEIGPKAVGIPFDVAGAAPMAELVDAAEAQLDGSVDIVLHAAGIQHREPAEMFNRDAWQRVLDVNLTAPFFLSQEIGRRQLEAGRAGSHIFVGSLTSHISVRDVVGYTASKSGIYGVLRNLSLEWSGRGIRANGIGPGYIQTEMTKALFDDTNRAQKILDRIPMGRYGTPEDMGGLAVFLASDASAYITGQLIMVDGGWSAS